MMALLAIREFAKGFMSSQIGKAEPNGFGRSSEREYTMRDDEQEGQGQEESIASGNLRRLRALWEKASIFWKHFKTILKQPATNLGPTLIGLLLYGYASLIGFLYEQELVHLFDIHFNLYHYLTFTDFPFLAVKNTISFIVFIFGLSLICIIIAIIVILRSLILDILYFLVSKIHKSLKYDVGLEWPGVKYANFRENISDDIDYSFKLKYYVVLLNAVILSIIKNIFILIFREFIPWLWHRLKSRLAWIGVFIFSMWVIFFKPLRRIILVVFVFFLLATPALIVLSPTLLGYLPDLYFLPDGKKMQDMLRDYLRNNYKFNEGQVHTARPPKCFQKAKQISSTEKYAIFSLSETSANGAEKLLAIPVSNLASFQVGELGPCKSETDVADMKGDIAKIQLELEQSSKTGIRRDGEIGTLKAVVKDLVRMAGGLAKAVRINTKDGSKRDEEITKLKVAVKDKGPIDGGLTQAVKKLQAGVKKNTEAGGRRDVAIDALWASVNTTWETVNGNAEAGVRRDVGIKANKESLDTTYESVKSNRLALQKSIEAGGRRDGEIEAIKQSAQATQEKLQNNIAAGVGRDGEIEAIKESVKKNTKVGGNRDETIKVLQESVQTNRQAAVENTQAAVALESELKTIKESLIAGAKVTSEMKTIKNTVMSSAKVTERIDQAVKDNANAAGKRDEEIKIIKETLQDHNKTAREIPAHPPGFPVAELIIIVKPGSKTKSEIRYLFAGYERREYELNDDQHRWLQNFYSAVNSCKNDSEPSIRLVGFASSEPYFDSKEMKQNNLCAPSFPKSPEVKNCYLAHQRVGRVAAFFRHLETTGAFRQQNRTFTQEEYDGVTQEIMIRMNDYCKDKEKGDLRFGLSHIKIKPWCKLDEMENNRISNIALLKNEVDGQPHFLNRSVHIIFENLGKCAEAGFLKIKQ